MAAILSRSSFLSLVPTTPSSHLNCLLSASSPFFDPLSELLFPLALVSRTARAVLVPAAFVMLVSIRVLMGPTFGGFLVANVVWVPWDAVGARLLAWRRQDRVADDAASRESYGVHVS